MKVFKRLAAALLTAALALSMIVVPASAAPGSFTDVSDPNTAVNADILRLMGVVSGTGDNRFNPSGALTRAQFCTMVVTFLQRGDEAPRYGTRTIFSDVRSDHWARSYVNLAASISVTDSDGENSTSIPLSPAWGTAASSLMTTSPWLRRPPSSSGRWATPARRPAPYGPRATWTWPSPPACLRGST